jgi:nucleotidyltransferase substrate binding protein (TIGR01987 family)
MQNFKKALRALTLASQQPIQTPVELAGTIKLFELTFETGWKAIKVYLDQKMGLLTGGPKQVFSIAYQQGVINNETVWLQILKDRNLSTHVYDQRESEELAKRIVSTHLREFEVLWETLNRP